MGLPGWCAVERLCRGRVEQGLAPEGHAPVGLIGRGQIELPDVAQFVAGQCRHHDPVGIAYQRHATQGIGGAHTARAGGNFLDECARQRIDDEQAGHAAGAVVAIAEDRHPGAIGHLPRNGRLHHIAQIAHVGARGIDLPHQVAVGWCHAGRRARQGGGHRDLHRVQELTAATTGSDHHVVPAAGGGGAVDVPFDGRAVQHILEGVGVGGKGLQGRHGRAGHVAHLLDAGDGVDQVHRAVIGRCHEHAGAVVRLVGQVGGIAAGAGDRAVGVAHVEFAAHIGRCVVHDRSDQRGTQAVQATGGRVRHRRGAVQVAHQVVIRAGAQRCLDIRRQGGEGGAHQGAGAGPRDGGQLAVGGQRHVAACQPDRCRAGHIAIDVQGVGLDVARAVNGVVAWHVFELAGQR